MMGMTDNTLEIAIIGALGAIIVAFIGLGGVFIYRLFNRVDRLSDQMAELAVEIVRFRQELGDKIAQSHQELNDKIGQSHQALNDKIDQSYQALNDKIDQSHQALNDKIDQSNRELRREMRADMEQMKAEILNALLHHSHPGPGEPPVFTAPPPVVHSSAGAPGGVFGDAPPAASRPEPGRPEREPAPEPAPADN